MTNGLVADSRAIPRRGERAAGATGRGTGCEVLGVMILQLDPPWANKGGRTKGTGEQRGGRGRTKGTERIFK